jgi:GAF domain-containing protein
MKIPQIPENEVSRLMDLTAYNLLGSTSEKIFDDITELAAIICGAKFAALTLIDSDRQWVKASYGMKFNHISRNESVCGHAILESDVFEVPNLGVDERFSGNPILNGHPRLRFYAGGQLRSSRGNAVGMLCVLDSEPGQLDEIQRNALRTLSRLVIEILEQRTKTFRTSDYLSALMAGLVDEIYVRDAKSMKYVFANEIALKSADCSLEQLLAGECQHKLEGDESNFPSLLLSVQSGETTVSFETTRNSALASLQRVNVTWNILNTIDSQLIISVVRVCIDV